MKKKLTATSETGQVFTRSTHRIYSHVVIVSGTKPEILAARLEQSRKYWQECIDDASESNWNTPYWMAKCKTLIDEIPERIAANAKEIEGEVYHSYSWAGRKDLAEKSAAKAVNEGYYGVRIIEVDAK